MKRNDLFVIKDICGEAYLLPVGQMIADYNRGIKINPTCSYVWSLLANEISEQDVLDSCAEYYGAEEDEREALNQDIRELLKAFRERGMIEGSKNIFKCNCLNCQKGIPYPCPSFLDEDINGFNPNIKELYGRFVIGGLLVEMFGDKGYFSESFEKFRIMEFDSIEKKPMQIEIVDVSPLLDNENRAVQYYDETMISGEAKSKIQKNNENYESLRTKEGISANNRSDKGMDTIIHNNELTVIDDGSRYVLFFNELDGVEELHLSKDGRLARFYCDAASDKLKENLFYAIRIAFNIYALENGRVMLHSCSILFKDMVWAFSAPSGTGKSTHCEIWHRLFNVELINGDLNMIGMRDGIPYVYGTPWCGTSEIFDNETRKLGGIILLKRGLSNKIEEISEEKKILLIQQRLTTSVWNREMLYRTFDIVTDIVKNIYVKRYYCNKEDEAGILLHNDIAGMIHGLEN